MKIEIYNVNNKKIALVIFKIGGIRFFSECVAFCSLDANSNVVEFFEKSLEEGNIEIDTLCEISYGGFPALFGVLLAVNVVDIFSKNEIRRVPVYVKILSICGPPGM